jgi:hypothetical protein
MLPLAQRCWPNGVYRIWLCVPPAVFVARLVLPRPALSLSKGDRRATRTRLASFF